MFSIIGSLGLHFQLIRHTFVGKVMGGSSGGELPPRALALPPPAAPQLSSNALASALFVCIFSTSKNLIVDEGTKKKRKVSNCLFLQIGILGIL